MKHPSNWVVNGQPVKFTHTHAEVWSGRWWTKVGGVDLVQCVREHCASHDFKIEELDQITKPVTLHRRQHCGHQTS